MSNQILYYIMGIIGGLFALIVIAYLVIRSKTNKGDMKKIRQLRKALNKINFLVMLYIKNYITSTLLFLYLNVMYLK